MPFSTTGFKRRRARSSPKASARGHTFGLAERFCLATDGVAEHVFDIANHFNRGAALLIDRDEKVHVAAIDLRAGLRAKASPLMRRRASILRRASLFLTSRTGASSTN